MEESTVSVPTGVSPYVMQTFYSIFDTKNTCCVYFLFAAMKDVLGMVFLKKSYGPP
ncbi:hypothetical protein HanIR_Chr14g0686051 [Helianthus annuus]|nr:hypothetical protein HanIR_Chr14g0686051 [Helianthus annuus]